MTEAELKERARGVIDGLSAPSLEALLRYAKMLGEAPQAKAAVREGWNGPPHEDYSEIMERVREAEQYAPIPEGLPGRDLHEFAGMLTREEAEQMRREIEEACERMPPDE